MKIVETSATDLEIIRNFLVNKNRLDAITYLYQTYGFHLRDANHLVKQIEENPEKVIFRFSPTADLYRKTQSSFKTRKSKVFSFMYYFFLFAGLCLLSGGIYNLTETFSYLKNSEKIEGIVVSYETYVSVTDHNREKNSQTVYTPVIRFTFNNQVHERKTKTSSSAKEYAIDEPVSIYVNKEFPKVNQIYLDNFIEKYGLIIVLLLFGIFLTGVSFIIKSF